MESELIRYLRRRLPPHPLLKLGPGDDAAVISMAGVAECVLTVDMLMDRVDFRVGEVDPRRIGRKSLAVNLSDLAAMAAEPLAGVVALALPRSGGMDLAVNLYEGLIPLAERYALAVAGGDTNSWDGPLVISITLLGRVGPKGPLLRSGARPGDWILVTGEFGGSILGHHFDFEPRLAEARLLNERYTLHAGIDVSDGLSIDLARLCQESGCGALVRTADVPISEDAGKWAAQVSDGSTPLDHALGDGEDFELILAVPPEEAARILADQPLQTPITHIGECIDASGLWATDDRLGKVRLATRGYEHELN